MSLEPTQQAVGQMTHYQHSTSERKACMRLAALIVICCTGLNIGFAQVKSTHSLEPTPLEVFAARPSARVYWSKVIGHLESQESRATVTALIIQDQTSEKKVMRGIRVDLRHLRATPSCNWKYVAWKIMCQRPNAAVYIEEERLVTLRTRLRRGAAQLRPMEFISQYKMRSAHRTSTGLIVCGYQFTDRRRADLADLLTRAISELKLPGAFARKAKRS